jgi:hypothetical protein
LSSISEGEREDALCDPEREAGWCAGEVVFEPHLLFQVREDAFDHQSRGGECPLVAEVGGGAVSSGVTVGGEQERSRAPRS